MTPRIGRFHVITDTSIQQRFDHAALASLAVAGGADVVQLRDKVAPRASLAEDARRVGDVCRPAGVLFVVNDDVDLAIAVGAGGVHLGSDDTPVAQARRRAGEGFVIGATAGTVATARAAEDAGADYIGFGHVFPTASKEKPTPPVGLDTLAAACAAVTVPVIAIGGIGAGNVAGVIAAGAWGVAVIGAVCGAEDPEAAAREMRGRIDAAVAARGRG